MSHLQPHEIQQNVSEVQMLSRCDYPNVLKFHKAWIIKEECWLLTGCVPSPPEYVDGGTLADLVKSISLDEPALRYVAHGTLSALAYLHSLGRVWNFCLLLGFH